MLFFNRTLPLIVAFAFGMLGIVIYYIPHSGAQSVEREMALWVRIVFAFAYLLGLYSLLNLHWQRIRQHAAGWGYSLVAIASFSLMMLFVVYNDGHGPFAAQAAAGGYKWFFDNVHVAALRRCFRSWPSLSPRPPIEHSAPERRRRRCCWSRRSL